MNYQTKKDKDDFPHNTIKINPYFIQFSHSGFQSTTKSRWVPVITLPKDKTSQVENTQQKTGFTTQAHIWTEFHSKKKRPPFSNVIQTLHDHWSLEQFQEHLRDLHQTSGWEFSPQNSFEMKLQIYTHVALRHCLGAGKHLFACFKSLKIRVWCEIRFEYAV